MRTAVPRRILLSHIIMICDARTARPVRRRALVAGTSTRHRWGVARCEANLVKRREISRYRLRLSPHVAARRSKIAARARPFRVRQSSYFCVAVRRSIAIGTERNALALEEQYHTYASRDAMKPYGANWVGLCLRREHCNGWSRAWYDSWECCGGD